MNMKSPLPPVKVPTRFQKESQSMMTNKTGEIANMMNNVEVKITETVAEIGKEAKDSANNLKKDVMSTVENGAAKVTEVMNMSTEAAKSAVDNVKETIGNAEESMTNVIQEKIAKNTEVVEREVENVKQTMGNMMEQTNAKIGELTNHFNVEADVEKQMENGVKELSVMERMNGIEEDSSPPPKPPRRKMSDSENGLEMGMEKLMNNNHSETESPSTIPMNSDSPDSRTPKKSENHSTVNKMLRDAEEAAEVEVAKNLPQMHESMEQLGKEKQEMESTQDDSDVVQSTGLMSGDFYNIFKENTIIYDYSNKFN